MEATVESLESALRKADAAGNTADAKVLAGALRAMMSNSGAVPVPGAQPEPKQDTSSLTDKIRAGINTAGTVVRGMVTAPAAAVYALGHEMIGGPDRNTGFKNAMAALNARQPTTELEAQYTENVTNALTPLQALPSIMGIGPVGAITRGARALPAMAANSTPVQAVGRVGEAIAANRAAVQAAKATESGNDALRLNAIRVAQDNGWALNPKSINPTAMNKVGAALTELDAGASEMNRPKANARARQDVGIPQGTALSRDAYKTRETAAAQPYEDLKAIPRFVVDEEYLRNLNQDNFISSLPQAEQLALAKSKAANSVIQKFSLNEISGPGAVEMMKEYRARAFNRLNNISAKPEDIALGKVELNAARQLEGLIDRELARMHQQDSFGGYGDLMNRFREGREQIAKLRTYESVTTPAGDIDAVKLAKLKDRHLFTGGMKEIADVAGVFPEAFGSTPPRAPVHNLGTKGGRINQLIGVAATPIENAMLSPGYQRRAAQGIDARPIRERMGYSSAPPPPVPASPPAPMQVPEAPPVVPLPGTRISLAPAQEPPTPFPIISDDPNLALRVRQMQGEKGVLSDLSLALNEAFPTLSPEMQTPGTPVLPGTRLSLASDKGQRTPFPVLADDVNALNRVGQLQGEPGSSLSLGNALVQEPLTPIPVQQAYTYGNRKTSLIAREVSDLMELTTPPDAAGKRVKFKTIDMPLRQDLWQQPKVVKAMESFKEEAQYLNEILGDKATDTKLRAEATKELRRMKQGLTDLVSAYGVNAKDSKAHGLRRPLYQTSRNRLAR